MADVDFATNDPRNGVFRSFLKSSSFGLKRFHQIAFENECDKDRLSQNKIQI